jgi:hypothetical protein
MGTGSTPSGAMSSDDLSRLRQDLDSLRQRLDQIEQRQRAAGSTLSR